MYELESENLTGLGGPMGTERTWTNFRKYYSTVDFAIDDAEKEYGEPLQWIKTENGFRSFDLGNVMYHIRQLKIEK